MKGAQWDTVRVEVVNLLRDMGLVDVRSQLAISLSMGMQRRLCTAMAIIVTPKVRFPRAP